MFSVYWETGFFVHQSITPAVNWVEFVIDGMSYIALRGRWCNIIVLNVHAPSEEKSDDSKDSFYEELEQVSLYHFPKYQMKILLWDFNSKVGRENVFKLTIGNERLHQDSNGNGVRIVALSHQNIWLLRAWCSCTEKFTSTPGPLLMGRLTTRWITYW